jgi:hypothetical protein
MCNLGWLRTVATWVAGFVLLPSLVLAQDVIQRPFPSTAEYFAFWEGTWYRTVNGRPDTTGTRFLVRRGVHEAAWEEDWRLRVDSSLVTAKAIRAWDARKNQWQYVWVSSQGHCQVWEERQVGSDWYFYRTLAFPPDRYLSRQGWLPLGSGRLRRFSQKSYDGALPGSCGLTRSTCGCRNQPRSNAVRSMRAIVKGSLRRR